MALKELGVEIEPFMSAKADLCRECVWGIASRKYFSFHFCRKAFRNQLTFTF